MDTKSYDRKSDRSSSSSLDSIKQKSEGATLLSNTLYPVGENGLAYDEHGQINLISSVYLEALFPGSWQQYTRWCYEELENGCMSGHFVIGYIELLIGASNEGKLTYIQFAIADTPQKLLIITGRWVKQHSDQRGLKWTYVKICAKLSLDEIYFLMNPSLKKKVDIKS